MEKGRYGGLDTLFGGGEYREYYIFNCPDCEHFMVPKDDLLDGYRYAADSLRPGGKVLLEKYQDPDEIQRVKRMIKIMYPNPPQGLDIPVMSIKQYYSVLPLVNASADIDKDVGFLEEGSIFKFISHMVESVVGCWPPHNYHNYFIFEDEHGEERKIREERFLDVGSIRIIKSGAKVKVKVYHNWIYKVTPIKG